MIPIPTVTHAGSMLSASRVRAHHDCRPFFPSAHLLNKFHDRFAICRGEAIDVGGWYPAFVLVSAHLQKQLERRQRFLRKGGKCCRAAGSSSSSPIPLPPHE